MINMARCLPQTYKQIDYGIRNHNCDDMFVNFKLYIVSLKIRIHFSKYI